MNRNLKILEKLLVEVAICPPLKKNQYAYNATIPWDLVERIRSEVEAMGVDWRGVKKTMHEIIQRRRDENTRV